MARPMQDYELVMRLSGEGYNQSEISRTTNLPRTTVRSWVNGVSRPAGTAYDRHRLTGDQALHFKGDAATPESVKVRGRRIARKLYPKPKRCERCMRKLGRSWARHHVDGDTMNNKRSNVMLICQSCHLILDNPQHRS